MTDSPQTNPPCEHCGGSGIEEVYGGHGTVLELPCRHCKPADRVCHEDQLLVWASEVTGTLSMGDFLRDDLSYDDGLDLHRVVMREVKRIVAAAFRHPELGHDQ